jgi:hypothetical protein
MWMGGATTMVRMDTSSTKGTPKGYMVTAPAAAAAAVAAAD